jgi:hypothetical protein
VHDALGIVDEEVLLEMDVDEEDDTVMKVLVEPTADEKEDAVAKVLVDSDTTLLNVEELTSLRSERDADFDAAE